MGNGVAPHRIQQLFRNHAADATVETSQINQKHLGGALQKTWDKTHACEAMAAQVHHRQEVHALLGDQLVEVRLVSITMRGSCRRLAKVLGISFLSLR